VEKLRGEGMNIFLEMFIAFFKIGCLAFGGGYAVIAILQKEVVELKQWVDNDELTDIMAISKTLPANHFCQFCDDDRLSKERYSRCSRCYLLCHLTNFFPDTATDLCYLGSHG